MTNTTTTGGLSVSRDSLDEDDYAPTRWENFQWPVTNTTGWHIIRAAERLRMLGERVAGDKPLTDEESRKRNYGWGYEMGRKTAVRQLARTVLSLRQPLQLDDLGDVAGSLGLKPSELVRAAEADGWNGPREA